MTNFYNSVPQGRFAPAMGVPSEMQASKSPQAIEREFGSNITNELASREYADASRALAMAQINMGNKQKYCSVPIGYKN